MLDVLLAFAAGVLTIAAPCVLPMLPIVLGATIGRTDPTRPIFIMLGFAATFALVALLFGLFPTLLGLSQESLRDAAILALLVFGLLMIWPHPFELLTSRLADVVSGHPLPCAASPTPHRSAQPFSAQHGLGAVPSLGHCWSRRCCQGSAHSCLSSTGVGP